MVGAKKASKMKNEKAKEAKAAAGGDQGGKKGGKGGQGRPQKARARDEIVPWGWEQAAKDERKKKHTERTQAEAAARAAKEMADLGLADKPAKKQPAPAADPAAGAKDGAAPAPAAKKGGK